MKNPAPISFRYCAIIQESVDIWQPHYKWGEEIAFEDGRISDFKGLVTLTVTLDRVILHTVMHHSSTSTYIPNFVEIEETFCGRTDVRTGNLRPTLLGRLRGVGLKNTTDYNIVTPNQELYTLTP